MPASFAGEITPLSVITSLIPITFTPFEYKENPTGIPPKYISFEEYPRTV